VFLRFEFGNDAATIDQVEEDWTVTSAGLKHGKMSPFADL
jgi:hypothetical protein